MNYLDLLIGNRIQDNIWSRSKGPTTQSDGSRHKQERLKYKQDNIACPQLYSSRRDRIAADMDPSAHCIVFSDDVHLNGECYSATQNNLLDRIC
jgi:hypothetical protein